MKSDQNQCSIVLDIIELGWRKESKNPRAYKTALQQLRQWNVDGTNMDTKFFYNIDVPVHPQFLLDKL